jgi:hypothetical protein
MGGLPPHPIVHLRRSPQLHFMNLLRSRLFHPTAVIDAHSSDAFDIQ